MSDVETVRDILNRAWEATWQGGYREALRIYDEEFTPLNEPVVFGNLTNWAILHTLMGNLDIALVAFREQRNLPPPPAIPVPFVGTILWMQGKYREACEDWAYEIGRRRSGVITHSDEAGGVVVPALLWWASAHPGLEIWKKLAEQELKRRGRTKHCQTSRWPGPLVPFLLGQDSENTVSDSALVDAASTYSSRYPNLNFRYRCLAHFYVGADWLARGDSANYLTQLKQVLAAKSSVATGGEPPKLDGRDALRLLDPEYHLARAELQSAKENNHAP